jgi:hypothetical protein
LKKSGKSSAQNSQIVENRISQNTIRSSLTSVASIQDKSEKYKEPEIKPVMKESEKTFDFSLSDDDEWGKDQFEVRDSNNLFGKSFNALDDGDSFSFEA